MTGLVEFVPDFWNTAAAVELLMLILAPALNLVGFQPGPAITISRVSVGDPILHFEVRMRELDPPGFLPAFSSSAYLDAALDSLKRGFLIEFRGQEDEFSHMFIAALKLTNWHEEKKGERPRRPSSRILSKMCEVTNARTTSS